MQRTHSNAPAAKKNSVCVNLMEKLWQLYSGTQKESSALNTSLGLCNPDARMKREGLMRRLREATRRYRKVTCHLRQGESTHSTSDTRVVAVVFNGTSNQLWPVRLPLVWVADSTTTRKWKWLFVNGGECKSKEFEPPTRWDHASVCLEIMFKKNRVE
jgi:hypothetical protein